MGQAKQRGTREERIARAKKLIEEERAKHPPKEPEKLSPESAAVIAMGLGMAEALDAPWLYEYQRAPMHPYPPGSRYRRWKGQDIPH